MITRRQFLKASSLALLGLAVRPAIDALARLTASSPPDARWAMAVDLAACKTGDGCADCIQACHSVHNVPDIGNIKQEVKWLWKVPFENALPDESNEFINSGLREAPALVLCNHCTKPPCVSVCPTQATFKRDDGIVMMDYHRCIGCRYCMAACPYGSRSFNWQDPRPFIKETTPAFPTRTKGVVEKCNFCEERLANGQPPACVEACEEKALIFGNLLDEKSEIRQALNSRYAIRRRPGLGTEPAVFYLV